MTRPAVWLPLLFVFLVFSCGYSQVPALVNYQGRLANPDGSPLPTADYSLTFKIYDAATNGALIWGPQVFDGLAAQGHGGRIPVVQGYFNVMLGPVDTNGASLADAFNGTARYVEVTVSNRPPIAPRQQILTTPFAFQAANSAKLAGYDWGAVFGSNDPVNGKISGSKLANGSVTAQQIANGTITVQQLAPTLATNQLWSIGSSPGSIFYNAPVGIGTTNPIGSLQVIGFTSIGGVGDPGTLRIYSDAASANGSWGEFYPDNAHPGRTVFQGGKGSASTENSLQVAGHLLGVDDVHAIGTATNRWNSIRIGTGNGIFEGNVGVGKTNPTTRLDVNGTVTATAFSGSGVGLTGLNGTNMSEGTIPFGKLAQRQVGTNVGLGGIAISLICTQHQITTFGSYSDVTNLSVTIATTGRPVFVGLIGTFPSGDGSYVYVYNSSSGGARGSVAFLQGPTTIASQQISLSENSAKELAIPPSSFHTIAFPPAGTWTYKVQALFSVGTLMEFYYVRLVAFEL